MMVAATQQPTLEILRKSNVEKLGIAKHNVKKVTVNNDISSKSSFSDVVLKFVKKISSEIDGYIISSNEFTCFRLLPTKNTYIDIFIVNNEKYKKWNDELKKYYAYYYIQLITQLLSDITFIPAQSLKFTKEFNDHITQIFNIDPNNEKIQQTVVEKKVNIRIEDIKTQIDLDNNPIIIPGDVNQVDVAYTFIVVDAIVIIHVCQAYKIPQQILLPAVLVLQQQPRNKSTESPNNHVAIQQPSIHLNSDSIDQKMSQNESNDLKVKILDELDAMVSLEIAFNNIVNKYKMKYKSNTYITNIIDVHIEALLNNAKYVKDAFNKLPNEHKYVLFLQILSSNDEVFKSNIAHVLKINLKILNNFPTTKKQIKWFVKLNNYPNNVLIIEHVKKLYKDLDVNDMIAQIAHPTENEDDTLKATNAHREIFAKMLKDITTFNTDKVLNQMANINKQNKEIPSNYHKQRATYISTLLKQTMPIEEYYKYNLMIIYNKQQELGNDNYSFDENITKLQSHFIAQQSDQRQKIVEKLDNIKKIDITIDITKSELELVNNFIKWMKTQMGGTTSANNVIQLGNNTKLTKLPPNTKIQNVVPKKSFFSFFEKPK